MCRLITLRLLHLKEMKTDAPVQCSGAFLLLSGLCRPGLNKIRTLPCKSKAKSNELKTLHKKQGEGVGASCTRSFALGKGGKILKKPLDERSCIGRMMWHRVTFCFDGLSGVAPRT